MQVRKKTRPKTEQGKSLPSSCSLDESEASSKDLLIEASPNSSPAVPPDPGGGSEGEKKVHGSRMQLLEPEGTSKEAQCQELLYRETSPPSSVINEVSTLAETEGKAQEAPSQRVQEEGTLATRRKGVQQGGETNTELRQPEDPGK